MRAAVKMLEGKMNVDRTRMLKAINGMPGASVALKMAPKRSLQVPASGDGFNNIYDCAMAANTAYQASSTTPAPTTTQTMPTTPAPAAVTIPTSAQADIDKWCSEAAAMKGTTMFPSVSESYIDPDWGYMMMDLGGGPFWSIGYGMSPPPYDEEMHKDFGNDAAGMCVHTSFNGMLDVNDRKILATTGLNIDAILANQGYLFDNQYGFLNGQVEDTCMTNSVDSDLYGDCHQKIYQLRRFCSQAQVDAVLAKEKELFRQSTCTSTAAAGTYVKKFYTDDSCTEEVGASHAQADTINGALRPEQSSIGMTHASGATATAMNSETSQQLGCRQGLACDRASSAGGKATCKTDTFKTNVTMADMTFTVSQFLVTIGLFPSTSIAVKAGDIYNFLGFPDCDENDGDKDCSLDHWKAKLGMAVCEATDTGDYSNICVTDKEGKERCATDCALTGDACMAGASAPASSNKNTLIPIKNGNTGCKAADAGADGSIDMQFNGFMALDKVCATNDYKCNNGATCAAAPAGANQCNPSGSGGMYCSTTYGAHMFESMKAVSAQSWMMRMADAFAENCAAGGSPFSTANPAVGAMGYRDGFGMGGNDYNPTIPAASKCTVLYQKSVLVPAAAAPAADSFAASSKSFSLVTMLVASVLAIFSFRG
jgi:hypothetical protein